jgi:hypothetical protein
MGAVVHRLDTDGFIHTPKEGAAAFGSLSAHIDRLRLALLAHRPRLPWRIGADATTARRVCGLVLPELRSVGGGALSRGAS